MCLCTLFPASGLSASKQQSETEVKPDTMPGQRDHDMCRYPSLATLPSGSVFVAGGSITEAGGYDGAKPQYNNPSYQIYSPIYKTMTPSVYMQQLVRLHASVLAWGAGSFSMYVQGKWSDPCIFFLQTQLNELGLLTIAGLMPVQQMSWGVDVTIITRQAVQHCASLFLQGAMV